MIAIGQLGSRLYFKSQKEWLYWDSDVFFLHIYWIFLETALKFNIIKCFWMMQNIA